MELASILHQYNLDSLKALAKLCGCGGRARKDELIACIRQMVTSPASLRQLWHKLDDLSKKAVAAAYHNEGEFSPTAFAAQYGSLPERPKRLWGAWSANQPIPLDLFIYSSYGLYNPYNAPNPHIPSDLMPLLAGLVPPPDKFQLTGLAEAPRTALNRRNRRVELIRADTEQAGWHDLTAYLRLVQAGKIGVSSTQSYRATLSSIREIAAVLLEGDFFPLPEKYRVSQTIRPFGLDVFANEAGLVTYNYLKGLHLTEMGQALYQTQAPELLLEAFETWTQSGYFDELSRIPAIKGQKATQTHLTKAAARREAVIEALSWCPVGVWIDLQDFYRAVKIWHFDFDVETTVYSGLYVGSKDRGALYGAAYWPVVKGLYINVVLWEYLGSLGALDLLYTAPEEAIVTTHLQFYGDPYVSLYDGLRYFRINNLGAYLLGQAGEYHPAKPLNPPLFTISADLQVTLINPAQLTPNDRSLLEQVAVPAGNGHYCLDTQRLLTALEEGQTLAHLADFLQKRHLGPLPEAASAWLERMEQNSQAFTKGGPALLIKTKSPELAQMAAADPILQRFCYLIDKRTLVIPASREKALRARLKELEYILAS